MNDLILKLMKLHFQCKGDEVNDLDQKGCLMIYSNKFSYNRA